MKGDPVPNPHHIARYCGGTQINEDGSISGAAFRLRAGEEFLSVNWLEFLYRTTRDEIGEIRRVLGAKLRLGATAKIAVLGVGQLRRYVHSESPDKRDLRVLHEPELPGDPSHSGVFNVFPDDDLIADLIAEIVQETHPVKS